MASAHRPKSIPHNSVVERITMDLCSSRETLETPLLSSETSPPIMHENDGQEVEENDSNSTEALHRDSSPANVSDAWYHNPYQIMAMISNYSTSYNVVNISLVLPILKQLQEKSSSEDQAACASSLLAGMVVGQLVGGALGDSFLGRLGALKVVMTLQIIASLFSSLLSISHGDIYIKLALCRFFLGIGAGGVYPLAAVLSAEHGKSSPSSASSSGSADQVQRVVLTFSTQGLGFATVPLVAVLLLYTTSNLNVTWRLLLGLGCVPGLVMMIMQWHMYKHTHSRGTAVLTDEPGEEDVLHTGETAVHHEPIAPFAIEGDDTHEVVPRRVGWWEAIRSEPGLGRKVVGTAGTWCLFDILFYGNTLFQPIVVEAAFGSTHADSPIDLLQKTAVNSLILTSISLPGYFVAGLLIGKRTGCVTQTPRYVMLQGFAAMSILYCTIGSNWSYLRRYPAGLVTLYGLTFFFANYGPNTTTFILPSLLYSPDCRSTLNGISAAAGKLGALLGATLFAPAANEWGDDIVMLICSGVAVVAFVVTWGFVPRVGYNSTPPHPLEVDIPEEEEEPHADATFESA